MKHLIVFNLALAVALCAGGCATIKVQDHYDSSVDFTSYKTYSWHPDGRGELKGATRNPDDAARALEDAIDQGLADRGYVYQPKNPDFLVRYYGSLESRTDIREVNGSYKRDPGLGWSIGGGKEGRWGAIDVDTEVDSYEEGTLFLDIHSRETGKLVWRGKAISVIRIDMDREERNQKINEAVSRLLDRFPPKK